ncbi:MAG TPA: nucleotidyltransferase family protein [Candidatus Sulfotelmatobacter sp.]|nr:nucleotidyltransferase family protein [Candidatus Sulfotelmatobacter sp.]
MRAMILAAGLGTRLRPLTNDRPKALVEIGGRTLLEIALSRLRTFGINEVIVNVHHFADKVVDYLTANRNFGMHVEISREEQLLDTGGGLKKASYFFLENPGREEPFILHNVDVISAIDIARMATFHVEQGALATMAAQDRETSRYLLFDEKLQLHGRKSRKNSSDKSADQFQPLAFAGIHVISPRIFEKMTEHGAFSIVDCYLRLAATGDKICGFRADEYYWRDLGRLENVQQAERDIQDKIAIT